MRSGKRSWFVYLAAAIPLIRAFPLIRLKADSTHTIADYIERQVKKHGKRLFMVFEDQQITYLEFNALANRAAHWALAEGFRAGDTIGFMMANRIEYVPIWSGLTKIGVRAALINTNLRGNSVLHALEVAGTKHLLVGDECLDNLGSISDDVISTLTLYVLPEIGLCTPTYPGAINIRESLTNQPTSNPDRSHRDSVRTGDSAFYIYTSGTTGLPKASKFNHQKLTLFSLLGPLLGLRKGKVVYCPLPLYHGAGGVGTVMMALGSGGTIALVRKFSASRFWTDVSRYNATGFIYIGELCRFLLNQPPNPDDGKHGLKFMFGTGLRPDIWRKFQERFRVPWIVEAYGATESNIGAFNFSGKIGSVGKLRGATLLRYDVATDELIRDSEGRYMQCDTGEVGELVSKIPRDPNALLGQFQGYTTEEATEKKILRNVKRAGDAYFRSGDLLRQDADGYFYFIDRIGDTFRWKGENVSTQEVAEALSSFPGVETVNVYGVEIPGHEGRAGMAALVFNRGWEGQFDAKAFHEHVVSRLPSYAIPIFLRVCPESDITETFKLRKVSLRREGYDPERIAEPIYIRDVAANTYTRLHTITDVHIR
ncbi:MAG: long-chain-acyl-CoA synthetase [Gammaproteobacteria bacterium]|nr:long-chain-acyl-CoA synthetase [Gammaproteobacteria bacterium]